MKKQCLILFSVCVSYLSFGQINLRNHVAPTSENNQFVIRLSEEEKQSFSPTKVEASLGLNNNNTFSLLSKENDALGVYYRYQQKINNIPVENSMLIAHTRNGELTVVSGNIITSSESLNKKTKAILSASVAVQRALEIVNAKHYAWENNQESNDDIRKSNTPVAELVWYCSDEFLNAENLTLAYKVVVYATAPLSRAAYYFDATSGSFIGKKDMLYFVDATGTAATVYSGTQNIHSDLNGTSYRLRDLTKGSGIITLHGETSTHSDYSSTTANWSYTTNDKYALDAHYGVSQTYDFYFTNFNRNSINNAGFALTSYVNETATTNNAYWDGSIMHYGVRSTNGAGITAIDVTAHELTHGLTQYTSNLTYSNESGAMNESMSDIFGKAVQFWSKPNDINWLLSNDMAWGIRDMSNPKLYSQPNCYQGTNWYTGTADNGGVHTNSGVGNYFYYLLVNGGSATNDKGNAYTVTGLGLTKANAIVYRSETVYLTPSSNYAAWRTACINAAIDLYGAGSSEVNQVMNAWYAVGVGAQGATGTCSTPSGLVASLITDTTASVSWTAATGAASYALQYKTNAATTWTTINTNNTSANLTGLTPGTIYNFQVQSQCTAGGASLYSAATNFTTTGTAPITYCVSKGTNVTREYINKVAIGTISNTSGSNAGYANFTNLSTNLAGGTTVSITLTPGYVSTSRKEYWNVWIDYNKNGVFTDAGEKVTFGNATGVLTKSFVIPTTALNGTTRMRIQMQYNAYPTTSCTTYTSGEVEDYTVNITGNAARLSEQFNNYVLFPNPTTDVLHLNMVSEKAESKMFNIYNSIGQLQYTVNYSLAEGMNYVEFNTSELEKGIYILKIDGEQPKSMRFAVEH
ncbi:MAG: M4 family metallopeptidase [Bacteroidota bacterium]